MIHPTGPSAIRVAHLCRVLALSRGSLHASSSSQGGEGRGPFGTIMSLVINKRSASFEEALHSRTGISAAFTTKLFNKRARAKLNATTARDHWTRDAAWPWRPTPAPPPTTTTVQTPSVATRRSV
ncbi:hypothetical protein NW759_004422 [Fusarium solani]|jgi:hypothetical protein|nr:hypothetical protein NW759_004422 [Fusarium solani]